MKTNKSSVGGFTRWELIMALLMVAAVVMSAWLAYDAIQFRKNMHQQRSGISIAPVEVTVLNGPISNLVQRAFNYTLKSDETVYGDTPETKTVRMYFVESDEVIRFPEKYRAATLREFASALIAAKVPTNIISSLVIRGSHIQRIRSIDDKGFDYYPAWRKGSVDTGLSFIEDYQFPHYGSIVVEK